MEQEKVITQCDIEDKEDKREERKFRHRIGYVAAMTACVAVISFVFMHGWTVVVQGRDLDDGPVATLFESISQIIGLIF